MIKTVFLILCMVLLTCGASAQTSSRIRNLEQQRKEALAEIETTNKMLRETKRTTTNLLVRLNLLVEQIASRRKVINLLNQEIAEFDKELRWKELNIKMLEKELQFKRKNYAELLVKMQYKKKAQDYLLFILSAESFSQSYRRARYLREFSAHQKQQAKEIIQKQEELTKERQELDKSRQAKLALLQNKESERLALQSEEENKQSEVTGLKKKEKTLQAQLNEKRKQAQELNRQIERAINEEVERAEREAKAAAKAAAEAKAVKEKNAKETGKPLPVEKAEPERVAEISGGYAMTKEERKLSADFAGNKGKLPFPIKGRYKITARFGAQKHQELKFVTIENNGIEIETTANADAYSVFNGEVTSVFAVPGYNNAVIVQHGNYRTIYANLRQVYVKKGDRISTGQSIGKIYTEVEKGNTATLYFELRKEKAKLNPEPWLN